MSDIIDALRILSGMTNDIADYKLNKSKYESAKQHEIDILQRKEDADARKLLIQESLALGKSAEQQNQKDFIGIMKDLDARNLNVNEIMNLNDKDSTDAGSEIAGGLVNETKSIALKTVETGNNIMDLIDNYENTNRANDATIEALNLIKMVNDDFKQKMYNKTLSSGENFEGSWNEFKKNISTADFSFLDDTGMFVDDLRTEGIDESKFIEQAGMEGYLKALEDRKGIADARSSEITSREKAKLAEHGPSVYIKSDGDGNPVGRYVNMTLDEQVKLRDQNWDIVPGAKGPIESNIITKPDPDDIPYDPKNPNSLTPRQSDEISAYMTQGTNLLSVIKKTDGSESRVGEVYQQASNYEVEDLIDKAKDIKYANQITGMKDIIAQELLSILTAGSSKVWAERGPRGLSALMEFEDADDDFSDLKHHRDLSMSERAVVLDNIIQNLVSKEYGGKLTTSEGNFNDLGINRKYIEEGLLDFVSDANVLNPFDKDTYTKKGYDRVEYRDLVAKIQLYQAMKLMEDKYVYGIGQSKDEAVLNSLNNLDNNYSINQSLDMLGGTPQIAESIPQQVSPPEDFKTDTEQVALEFGLSPMEASNIKKSFPKSNPNNIKLLLDKYYQMDDGYRLATTPEEWLQIQNA